MILKNSKELEHLKYKASSIKTFDFSTLHTIPHEQLKSHLSGLISTFICKNGLRRYKYVVVKYNAAYLLKMKVTLQINIWYILIIFE